MTIALLSIDLNETKNREPLHDNYPDPAGRSRWTTERLVVVTMRVDEAADLTRIRDAVEALTRPQPEPPAPESPSLPA